MIYKITSGIDHINKCGLLCLGEPDGQCQLFMLYNNVCYMGNFDNKSPVSGTISGTFTIYINYGNLKKYIRA